MISMNRPLNTQHVDSHDIRQIILQGLLRSPCPVDATPGERVEFFGVYGVDQHDGSPDYDGSSVVVECITLNTPTGEEEEYAPFDDPRPILLSTFKLIECWVGGAKCDLETANVKILE